MTADEIDDELLKWESFCKENNGTFPPTKELFLALIAAYRHLRDKEETP